MKTVCVSNVGKRNDTLFSEHSSIPESIGESKYYEELFR